MPLKVIVVGAGVGGPAVAAALAQKGHQVTIYERAQSTTEVGFAFRITSNADRCLKHIGVDPQQGGATQANTSKQLDLQGNVIREVRENTDSDKAKAAASVFASRPQLAKQLIDKAVENGVKIINGVKVESVDIEKSELTLADGSKLSADLIVAADGVHSAVRPHIVDSSKYAPQPTLNYNAFRFMIAHSAIQNDPTLAALINKEFRLISWRGERKGAIVYPVDFDRQYSVVLGHPGECSDNATIEGDNESIYNKRVSMETVLDIYADFDPRLHRLIRLADPEGFRIWKFEDLDEIPRWSVNRTVLIGDAAHAVLPYSFSGAGMTIEDAIVLAELFPADISLDCIASRLELFENIRKPRLSYVRDYARKMGKGEASFEDTRGYWTFLQDYEPVETAISALNGAVGQ